MCPWNRLESGSMVTTGTTKGDFGFGASMDSNNYNASKDATATGANSLNSGSPTPPATTDFTSVTAGSENLHLSGSTVPEVNAGADSGSPYDTDIDNVAVSGAWDIGADEFVAAGGTFTPIISLY